ncbi:TniB family NTP-binding protein [Ruegeria lacuscaerulensis]|uniref:TniB family NTP-binding protein n=1 Tax=Ruegeria lacuscaerulensis TaxID=55218 RepID=UPI001BE4B81E
MFNARFERDESRSKSKSIGPEPRQPRMAGLMVYCSSEIGKTMIAKRMENLYPTRYEADIGVTLTPILLIQAPPALDNGHLGQHVLAAIGAHVGAAHGVQTGRACPQTFARHKL